jgi:hypothetical protein
MSDAQSTAPVISPAQRRQQRDRRRNIGKAAIAVGVLAAAICIFALFIQVQVTVISGVDNYFCGAVIDGFALTGAAAAVCAEALGGYIVAAVASGVVALLALVAGIVLLVRNPR